MSLKELFQGLPDRNNTSFSKELYETLKQIKLAKDDFLRYHQKVVVEYLMRYNSVRGILIYHKMGSGKTLLLVSICEILMHVYPSRKVIFIANKSLHPNMHETIVKYHNLAKDIPSDNIEQHIKTKYRFVTMNASNMLHQMALATTGEQILDDVFESESESDLNQDQNNEPKNKTPRKLKEDKSIDLNLDESIVVGDEMHNLFNSIANGSKNAVGFYDAVMRARELKLVGLTGTPIINDPFEIGLAFNMFAGPIKMSSEKKHTTLFGEDYADFISQFVEHSDSMNPDSTDPKRPRIKHKDKFCDRILGLVSYYGADTLDLIKQFPLEYDIVVKRIPMSNKQYSQYITARDRELEENKRGVFKTAAARLKKSSSSSISSYRVRSRQISNFVYPDYASRTWRTETGKIKYETYIDKLKPESFEPFELAKLSPKFISILENLSLHLSPDVLKPFKPSKDKLKKLIEKRTQLNSKKLKSRNLQSWKPGIGPGVIYSQFLDSGVNLLAKVLEHYGFEKFNASKHKNPTYAIISGEISPEERAQIVSAYNNPANKDGSKLAVLFITQTGAEGLDLKRTQHIHVMEPYWHWARFSQVITRAVRLLSHADLDLIDQTVQPYIYLSDYPSMEQLTDKGGAKSKDLEARMKQEPTTDVSLYHKAIQNQMLIDDFLKAMQESSIDCMLHYFETGNCRICSPTGEILWHPDLHLDINEPSPCKPYTIDKIKTKSITIKTADTTKEYKYSKDSDGRLHIFEFKPAFNAYIEIFPDHMDYNTIMKLIS